MTAAATSELRLPAHPDYIVVAKRAAAGFACVAGFDVEAVDDLVIAVAQACENAIAASAGTLGPGKGQLRLSFKLEDQRLEVQVRSLRARAEEGAEPAPAEPRHMVAAAEAHAQALREAAAHDLALRVMGLFVDDCRYRVDARTGGLRVRLTKYRIS